MPRRASVSPGPTSATALVSGAAVSPPAAVAPPVRPEQAPAPCSLTRLLPPRNQQSAPFGYPPIAARAARHSATSRVTSPPKAHGGLLGLLEHVQCAVEVLQPAAGNERTGPAGRGGCLRAAPGPTPPHRARRSAGRVGRQPGSGSRHGAPAAQDRPSLREPARRAHQPDGSMID